MSDKSKSYNWYAWAICALGALFYSYEYLLRIAPSVMSHALEQHYNLTSGGFGLLSSFYYYAYVPMQIPVGLLMDRYGPKRLLTLACFICAIGTYLFGVSDMFVVAATGRFLVGLGSAFAFVGVLKLATMWLPEDKLALVAGLAAALGTVGAMVGDNALGYLVTHMGWKYTNDVSAIFGFILVVVLWFKLKDKQNDASSAPTKQTKLKQNIQELIIIARNKQIWINGLFGCLVYLPTTVVAELWGIPYLIHAHNLPSQHADFANSMIFLGFTCGAPLMGIMSDYFHRRKLPMMLGALGALVTISILMYMPGLSQHMIYVLLFVLGIFYSTQAIVFAVGRELAPYHAAGTAMAFTNMVVMLGGMFLQPMVGLLLDWSARSHLGASKVAQLGSELSKYYIGADYQFALSIVPLGIFGALILTFFLKETYAVAEKK